jgi:subtilisin family serine protease
MFWKRSLLFLFLLAGACRIVGEDPLNSITFGSRKVHSTRLLAKIKSTTGIPPEASRIQSEALASAFGLAIVHRYELVPGLVVLDVPPADVSLAAGLDPNQKALRLLNKIEALQNTGAFEYVEPDTVGHVDSAPTDARYLDGTLWGLENHGQNGGKAGADINALAAWDVTTGTNSVLVAVIDTGVRYTHLDLAPNMWTNPGEIPGNGIDDDGNGVIDDVHGYNAVAGTGDPNDDFGHGTHVAGTIGAAANNGYPHVGVAWNVSIMACKWITASDSGFMSDAIKCIDYAVKMKARISNNSWHADGTPDDDSAHEQALADAITAAGKAGHLFVVAAGNASSDNDVITTIPQSFLFDNMISVAAVNRKGEIASFSNFGRRSVHIGAPGVEIFSTWNGSDTDYLTIDGTSMACPHVVGVASLILAAHPKATVAEMRQRILNSARPIPTLSGKTVTGGMVDAFLAVNGAPKGVVQLAVDPPDGSDIILSTNTIFSATVTDLLPITNATVAASVIAPDGTSSRLTFKNDGVLPDLVALDDIYTSQFLSTNAGVYAFVFSVNASGKTGITVTNHYTVRGRPDNDQFAKPVKIDSNGGTVTSVNRLATLETGEPKHGGIQTVDSSLWYAWSPSINTSVLVDNLGSSIPTVVAVYTGDSLANAKLVAAGVPDQNHSSRQFTFNALQGVTYRIAVASTNSTTKGAFRLRVTPGGIPDVLAPIVQIVSVPDGLLVTTNSISISGTAVDPGSSASGVNLVSIQVNRDLPSVALGTTNWSSAKPIQLVEGVNTIRVFATDLALNSSVPVTVNVIYRPPTQSNDAFAFATALPGTNGVVSGSNTGATKEPGEPLHGGNLGGRSVWWSFTAPADGSLALSTTNSSFDTLLGVYVGDRVGSLTTLSENDDAFPGSGFSALSVQVRAGTTVKIAVDGFAGIQGNVSLSYSFTPASLVQVDISSGAGGNVNQYSGLYVRGSVLSIVANANAGYAFSGWSGTVTSIENPLNYTLNGDAKLNAAFAPVAYSDDFESGGLTTLPWQAGGDLPWKVQGSVVAAGSNAAQAGAITDGQSSSLILTTTTSGGGGSFDFKVSSEEGFDFLTFLVDGNVLGKWSGEVDWNTFSFSLVAGVHTFEWRYSKDVRGSAGADTAWLDNVQIHVRPPVTDASLPHLTISGAGSGFAQLLVGGQVGQLYVTQASRDLKIWSSVSTNVSQIGAFGVSLSIGTNDFQFYRVQVAR